jgi:hypothetical protein
MDKIRIPFVSRFVVFFLTFMCVFSALVSIIITITEFRIPNLTWAVVSAWAACLLIALYRSNKVILGRELSADDIKALKEDMGIFTYTDDGFTVLETAIAWSSIEKVIANYSFNHIAETISLVLIHDGNLTWLNEGMAGWLFFLNELELQLGIDSLYISLVRLFGEQLDGDVVVWSRESPSV